MIYQKLRRMYYSARNKKLILKYLAEKRRQAMYMQEVKSPGKKGPDLRYDDDDYDSEDHY